MSWRLLLKNVFLIAPLFDIFVCIVNSHQVRDNFEHTLSWPKYNRFGQISAVAVDAECHVYVFHRGDRQWDQFTFIRNDFAHKNEGPIKMETVVVLESKEGSLLKETGKNFFYLPHGLTVDEEHNVWVTDVAMHQVFKFPPINLQSKEDFTWKPTLTLGVMLVPGNDDQHFCKPTGVAVDKSTKEFYVSDGYCNGKIIKYDQSGNKLLSWGRIENGFPHALSGYILSIPHALALAGDKKILYVADREHFRVVSYDSELGKFKKTFAQELNKKIYSVAFFPLEGGLLFVLTNNGTSTSTVSVYNAENGKYLLDLSLKNQLSNPHDLAISPDGEYCYVVELNPYKIWKIKIDKTKISNILHNSLPENKKTEANESIEELIPVESKMKKSNNIEVGSSFLAVGLVISIVVISFLFFMLHYYKRSGHRRYETRRLILDDDENGIQLT